MERGGEEAEAGVNGMESQGNGHNSLAAPLLDTFGKEDVGLFQKPGMADVSREAKEQLRLGVPVVMMSLLDFSVALVSVAFVGRLGALNLAGSAMAVSFTNVFGFAILEGLSGGLETSAGQAFGAGQNQLLGILLQRGILVEMMFCVPLSFLWRYSPAVLLFWGQDPEIVELSGVYVVYLLPSLFAAACIMPIIKFLQVQGVTAPLAVVSCTVLCFHIPLCYLLIYVFDWGLIGAALAQTTSNFVTLLLLVSYLKFERSGILERTWPGWSPAAFRNLGPFLALALPSCAMTSFEWWVFEIIQIMSGWLPHPEVNMSAMTIGFQTIGLCFMLPLGLATAVGVRVANELGAQRPGRARWAVQTGMILATITGGVLALVLLIARNEWALIFTRSSETEVVELVASIMPSLVLSIIGVAWGTVLSGVLRGSGQQLRASIVNGVSLYGLAIPGAWFFGIKLQWGLQGLWWGMMAGVFLQLIGQIVLTVMTNWSHQAKRALERIDYQTLQADAEKENYGPV